MDIIFMIWYGIGCFVLGVFLSILLSRDDSE